MLHDLIAKNIPMGVILSQDGQICHMNEWAKNFSGYSDSDVIHRSFLDLVHPDDQEILINRYAEIMDGKDIPMDRRYRIYGKNGEIFWLMFRSRVVEYKGKQALISFLIDETESRKYEESLKKSEEKYRDLVGNIAEGIAVIQERKICFINKVLENELGMSLKEISDRLFLDFIHPDDHTMLFDRHQRRQDGKEIPEAYEVRLVKPDGTQHICEVRSSLISWEGEPAIQAAILDLTERKEAEIEKAQLEKRLIRMEKMEALGLLAGGVAHDLNNVLTGVVSYPELLLMDLPKDHPHVEALELIRSSGQKASTIVEDLLALARRGAMATAAVNLNTIILDYLSSPAHHALLSFHSNITLETNLSPDLLNIKGAEVHLQKAIMNLIINAVEAQPSGGPIIISTQNCYIDIPLYGYESIEEGEYVVVTIEDKGVGINPQDMQRIFEPFYTKKIMGRSGTGLGMAVVWGTVQDHSGYINVESVEEVGTKFYLYFPVFREKIADKNEPLPIKEYMGNNETILIVDDVIEQRQIGEHILNRLNYTVKSAASGEEALECLKNNPCDLVILDMIMDPGMDGLETYKRILECYPTQKTVVASGFSEDDRVREMQALGAGAYLKKPYSVEHIGMVLRKELKNQSS